MKANLKLSGHYELICKDECGTVLWQETIDNLITNEGLDYVLSGGLDGGTQITSWFVGLTDDAPTVDATDTLASHAGWVEVTDYTGNRQTWTGGTVSSQSVDNSASPASFSITGTATVGGAFLASVNSGTSGTLYSVGAFSGGDQPVVSGNTLTVTATFTSSDN